MMGVYFARGGVQAYSVPQEAAGDDDVLAVAYAVAPRAMARGELGLPDDAARWVGAMRTKRGRVAAVAMPLIGLYAMGEAFACAGRNWWRAARAEALVLTKACGDREQAAAMTAWKYAQALLDMEWAAANKPREFLALRAGRAATVDGWAALCGIDWRAARPAELAALMHEHERAAELLREHAGRVFGEEGT